VAGTPFAEKKDRLTSDGGFGWRQRDDWSLDYGVCDAGQIGQQGQRDEW